MPERPWYDALPFPLEHARHLRQVTAFVRQRRVERPVDLYHWEPERETAPGERPRRELALAVALTQAIQAGDGGYESRLKACQKLYKLGAAAPAEALKAAELLARSRIVSGATDVETFWLVITLAQPARAVVPPAVSELAWRYLVSAPFCLDPQSAVELVRASQRHRTAERPRWPWELVSGLLEGVEQRELAITLLEAFVCVHLKAPSIEAAAARLPVATRLATPLFTDAVITLANLYREANLDAVAAREVARQAAALGDRRASAWLDGQVFDLPYEELRTLVKAWIKGRPVDLDDFYRRAMEAGQLQVARRLMEMELVLRYGAWKRGPLYPSLEAVIRDLLAEGAPIDDPRLRELILRTGLLYSRTRHFTPAAQILVTRLTEDDSLFGGDPVMGALRVELQSFLRECDPYHTLEEAGRAMEARMAALDADARVALGGARAFLLTRFRVEREAISRAAEALASPFLPSRDDVAQTLEALLTHTLHTLHEAAPRLIDQPATQREIAAQAGVPWERLRDADVDDLITIARGYARIDRIVASSGGALVGLMGGPWGAALDLATVLGIAARAVARIGLCFGIRPESPEGLHLLAGSLALAASSDRGEGLIALLRDEEAVARGEAITSGILWASEAGPRLAPAFTARAITRLARLIGFGLTERQILRMVPLMGAVFAAGADYLFLRAVTEAALHLAVREHLMDQGPAPEEDAGGPHVPADPCW